MSPETWKNIAEGTESFLKSVAIILAGFWAYWKLFLFAERETSISSVLSAKVLPCTNKHLRMIEIRTRLKNHGKVPCQIDLAHSCVSVSSVVITHASQSEPVAWHDEPYFFKRGSEASLLNIPVGATKDEVQFVVVRYPCVYRVCTFYAQTEQDMRVFHRRIRQPLPPNLEHRSGWAN